MRILFLAQTKRFFLIFLFGWLTRFFPPESRAFSSCTLRLYRGKLGEKQFFKFLLVPLGLLCFFLLYIHILHNVYLTVYVVFNICIIILYIIYILYIYIYIYIFINIYIYKVYFTVLYMENNLQAYFCIVQSSFFWKYVHLLKINLSIPLPRCPFQKAEVYETGLKVKKKKY
jgi:hypothetical protein